MSLQCLLKLPLILIEISEVSTNHQPSTTESESTMRLLTHNYLRSNVKGTEKGYPLLIRPVTVVVEEAPLDRELLTRILTKIDYAALQHGQAAVMEHCRIHQADLDLPDLPETLDKSENGDSENDDAVMAALFRWLFEVHVLEGALICPDTRREFPIKDGIPNMILHEDEL